jgi:hypothetical protein
MAMNDLSKKALSVAKAIQDEVPKRGLPPAEGLDAQSDQVIAFSLLKGTRGYIEKTANQINGCYENGWFDACAVMIRRLIETLIIEAFEHHSISDNIKNAYGDFLQLNDLIDRTLYEKSWNISRNTKAALPKLKNIGDLSAHSRRYNAHRNDIEKIISDLRLVVQELLYLSGLK